MCGEEQLAGKGGLARKNSKIFLAGTSLVLPKCTIFLQKMYKVLAKMNQNVPIPCHGKKNVNLIPRRELLARKS